MSEPTRLKALESSGLLHPNAEMVTSPLFVEGSFFLAQDKVQVKYEMLRAHVIEGRSASAAAVAHGYSRSAFYLVKASFMQAGMTGLLDGRPGRQGPVKVTEDIVAFIRAAPAGVSGAAAGGCGLPTAARADCPGATG